MTFQIPFYSYEVALISVVLVVVFWSLSIVITFQSRELDPEFPYYCHASIRYYGHQLYPCCHYITSVAAYEW